MLLDSVGVGEGGGGSLEQQRRAVNRCAARRKLTHTPQFGQQFPAADYRWELAVSAENVDKSG